MDQITIERDVSIPMDDGINLKADIFRPKNGQPSPVLMSMGPYGKGVPWRVGYSASWKWITETYPDLLPGSSKELMVWETVDPETWIPWGYVVIRIDSRGAGRSPGFLDVYSSREAQDYYQAIEWAATQTWSTGKVGLIGISYFAISQWTVASLQPPHLTAIVPWEGAADYYRDSRRHGGIQSNGLLRVWYPNQVVSVQHGNPNTHIDPWLNERASGPTELSEEELEANRSNPIQDVLNRPLDCDWYQSRSAAWDKVTVPMLSAANWAGYGLHPRGNFEAFVNAASKQKWLECHPGRHEEWFYLKRGMNFQKRFFDHFLKGAENGWDKEPPVQLHVRRPFSSEFELRKEKAWPLPDTKWTKLYLSGGPNSELSWTSQSQSSQSTFMALEEPLNFLSPPLQKEETEITGPLAAKVFASSTTEDMDLFVTLQAFAPDGREVDFQGTVDPHTPLAQGWLRASHRRLDQSKSLPHRPYHTHDEMQPLEKNKIYELDIEIWPTHIILPAGFKLSLQISGKDFERPMPPGGTDTWGSRGCGPWLHNLPEDRPSSVFGGQTTIYTGGRETESYLLLPLIDRP